MKVREILEGKTSNGKMHKDHYSTASNHRHYSGLDDHGIYRFGLTMAGAPDNVAIADSMGSCPSVYAYSHGEEQIIDAAEQHHGVRGDGKKRKKSKEPDGGNTTSPIAQIKRNKHGV